LDHVLHAYSLFGSGKARLLISQIVAMSQVLANG